MVVFDQKGTLSETSPISQHISFYVSAVSGTIEVLDGIIGGAETSRGTFSTTGFKEISTPIGSNVEIPEGYYIKIVAGAGESCSIDGLHLRIVFQSNKRAVSGFDSGTPEKWVWIPYKNPIDRHFMGPGYWKPVDPAAPPAWHGSTFSNNYFYNGRGLTFDTDTKGYAYENPVYIIQYILRQILGYASTELIYASFTATHAWLANSGGPPTETFRTWKFGACINTARGGGEWLGELLGECGCWLYWSGEGGWSIYPINYNSIISGILTFSDTDSIRPMRNFKFYKSRLIYNRYVFNWDYDYARGIFRQQTVYDQNNKSELATSVADYGEITYPVQDYFFIHRTSDPIVSSTNATPIVVTLTRHGFSNGDKVLVLDHATNTNANGIWIIANVTTSTFELVGSAGNGVGGATGSVINLTENRSTQIDNLYSIYTRAFKDPRMIIEFETGLTVGWIEVGDNIRISHSASAGFISATTDFQIIEHRQAGDQIFIKAIEVVP